MPIVSSLAFCSLTALDRPKSRTLITGRFLWCDSIKFAGLISRWTIPSSCACCSPNAAWWTK